MTPLKKIGLLGVGSIVAFALSMPATALADDAKPIPGAPIVCKADPGVAEVCGTAVLRSADKVGHHVGSPSATSAMTTVNTDPGELYVPGQVSGGVLCDTDAAGPNIVSADNGKMFKPC